MIVKRIAVDFIAGSPFLLCANDRPRWYSAKDRDGSGCRATIARRGETTPEFGDAIFSGRQRCRRRVHRIVAEMERIYVRGRGAEYEDGALLACIRKCDGR